MDPRTVGTATSFGDLLADVADRWADWTDDELAELAIDDLAVMDLEEALS